MKLTWLLSCVLWAGLPVLAQTSVVISPDCRISFSIGGNGASAVMNNRNLGCYKWSVVYNTVGFSALTITFQSAPASGVEGATPGSWSTFAGTTDSGSNPSTAITQGQATYTGYYPFVRVLVSGVTGSGVVAGTINGWRRDATTGSIPTGSTLGYTVARGSKALATGAIASATCTTAQTDTATGTITTDTIVATFNGDPVAITGYTPATAGSLLIIVYPTANLVNFKVCNSTLASITPGAVTLNWRVTR